MSKLWLIAMLVRWSLAIENGGSLCFKVDWTLLVSKKSDPLFSLCGNMTFLRSISSDRPAYIPVIQELISVYECVKLRR